MRVTSDRRVVDVQPGATADVHVDVINTSSVIDGVSARVLGLDAKHVSTQPQLLSLFPDGSGRVTLSLDLPVSYAAGRHPLTVEVASHASAQEPEHLDLDLVVAAAAGLQLVAHPPVQRARRRASYVLDVVNRGNVPLDVTLSCTDADRNTSHRFSATTVEVPPGDTTRVQMSVRGPRHWFGHDTDRSLTVHAQATATEPHRAELGDDKDVADECAVTLRQRPLVSRGVLTSLVLAAIVGLWALAFLVGLSKVFGGDPFTKTAPASYFISQSALKGLAAEVSSGDLLGKNGPLPAGVGGVVAGRVDATSTGTGVGRIIVSAYRDTPHGPTLVTSSATQADGSYGVIGLFPDDYYLEFSSPGYGTVWYPDAPDRTRARPVSVTAQVVTHVKDVRIVGEDAGIVGQVDTGDTKHVRAVVTVRSLTGTSAAPVARTVTDAHGHYTLQKLPAPNSYQLSFTAPHYVAYTSNEQLGGGQTRYEPLVRLSAGAGSITGLVTDGTQPLGGVSVTANVNGRTFKAMTPTQGPVGRFVLSGLPTPGTYILTFARDAGTTTSAVERIGPGENKTLLEPVALIGGTDAVTGTVTDAAGTHLGGATVTVGGTSTFMSTTTLTASTELGAFTLTGLPAPGTYTLTATLPGYQPTTVPIELDGIHLLDPVTIPMKSALGGISGSVRKQVDTSSFVAAVGATITVSDGAHTHTTVAVADGTFRVSGLVPGHYSVTASLDGFAQQSTLVDVVAGHVATLPLDSPSYLVLTAGGG